MSRGGVSGRSLELLRLEIPCCSDYRCQETLQNRRQMELSTLRNLLLVLDNCEQRSAVRGGMDRARLFEHRVPHPFEE